MNNACQLNVAILVAMSFAVPTQAGAQQPSPPAGIAKCAAITSSVARLDCFDALARAESTSAVVNPESSSPNTAGDAGKWNVDIKSNPVDDSKTVILLLKDENAKAALIMRCLQGRPEVYIAWMNYLGSEAYVLSRIGEQPAETRGWSLSTDKKATFYPGDDGKLMRQLQRVDRFVAQVTPYLESPVTAVFDVRGLSKALEPLAATCKLPEPLGFLRR